MENNELKMPKFYDKVNVLRKPQWLKIRLQSNEGSAEVERIVKEVPYVGVLLKKNEDIDAMRRTWR